MRDQKGFDEWAFKYDDYVKASQNNNTYPFAGYGDILNAIVLEIKTKQNPVVLDLGFGTGNLTKMISCYTPYIYGQDFSLEMIKIAKRKIKRAKFYQKDLKEGLSDELLTKRFDFIVATYALHHLTTEEKKTLIDQLLKVLKPGGKIIIGDIAFLNQEELNKCKKAFIDEWDDEEYYFVYDELKAYYPNLTFKKMSCCGGILELTNDKKREVVAITGSTGGLGTKMVNQLAKEGYDLILLNRNEQKTNEQIALLKRINQDISISFAKLDLENEQDIKEISIYLMNHHFDYLILSSAIYNVPLKLRDDGLNNVFFVNFLANYYLLKKLKEKQDYKKIIIIGSVAHRFAHLNADDIAYSKSTKTNKIYGNSKRFLMLSAFKEFQNDERLAIAHPGVVYTNMTSHFSPLFNWLWLIIVRTILPNAKKAASVMLKARELNPRYLEWVGPALFDLWGSAKVKKIKGITETEIIKTKKIADDLYQKMQ